MPNKLSEQYFKPRAWESRRINGKTIYEWLGVKAFNRHININSTSHRPSFSKTYRQLRKPGTNFGGLPPAENMLESIEAFDQLSRRNETRHLAGLALNVLSSPMVMRSRLPVWMKAASVAQAVVYNVYPILLQRHNRIRTERAKDILQKRQLPADTSSQLPVESLLE